jgi:hypothetical protein
MTRPTAGALRRTLLVVLGIGAVAFVTAGLCSNADSGAVALAGDVAWFTFLIAFVVVVGLALAILVAAGLRRRPSTSR